MKEILNIPPLEKLKNPEENNFKKIKPYGEMTVNEARDFVKKLFSETQKNLIKDNPEKKISSPIQNKQEGLRREQNVHKELEKQYPSKEGYKILRERELCNKDGKPVRDGQTGEKRRIDFCVVKDGRVVDMIEVTSKTAPKREQLSKEYRIRDEGGNYIKDSDNNKLYKIPDNVESRVIRRD